jgi:hypothetical protein
MEEDRITITDDTENIYIKIPIELLVFAQENRPDFPCEITNVEAMVTYFKDRFLEFGADENRGSDLEEIIDEFFYDASEYGEEWIVFTDFNDED